MGGSLVSCYINHRIACLARFSGAREAFVAVRSDSPMSAMGSQYGHFEAEPLELALMLAVAYQMTDAISQKSCKTFSMS